MPHFEALHTVLLVQESAAFTCSGRFKACADNEILKVFLLFVKEHRISSLEKQIFDCLLARRKSNTSIAGVLEAHSTRES